MQYSLRVFKVEQQDFISINVMCRQTMFVV